MFINININLLKVNHLLSKKTCKTQNIVLSLNKLLERKIGTKCNQIEQPIYLQQIKRKKNG